MPEPLTVPLPADTVSSLGFDHQKPEFPHCESRSLVLERCANPAWKDKKDHTPRRKFFENSIKKPALPHKRDAWRDFLMTGLGLKPDDLLFGKLQARLMVNMAGGVMENAGLCLDRLTGIPYIPGSAVKGCARRMAIQTLFENGAGLQTATGAIETDEQRKQRIDICAGVLVQIARLFGWSDLEWRSRSTLKPRRNETDADFQKRWEQERSDFAWACGDDLWPLVSDQAVVKLAQHLRLSFQPATRGRVELPSYSGDVQFLPAYPFGTPPDPDLDLDIVTCHHKEYYAGVRQMPVALDIEDPIPVVFPAVASGHVFIFAVLGDDATLLQQARTWHYEQAAQRLLRGNGFTVQFPAGQYPTWRKLVEAAELLLKNQLRSAHKKAAGPSPLGLDNPRQTSAVYLRPLKVAPNDYRLLVFEVPHQQVLDTPSRRPSPVLKGIQLSFLTASTVASQSGGSNAKRRY